MLARIALVLLLLSGLGGLVLVGSLVLRSPPAPHAISVAQREPAISVLVASRMVHAGQLLRPDDIATRDFPASSVPAASVRNLPSDRSGLIGALLRVTLPAGALISDHDLVKPGDHSYLAAVLLPGRRAIRSAEGWRPQASEYGLAGRHWC